MESQELTNAQKELIKKRLQSELQAKHGPGARVVSIRDEDRQQWHTDKEMGLRCLKTVQEYKALVDIPGLGQFWQDISQGQRKAAPKQRRKPKPPAPRPEPTEAEKERIRQANEAQAERRAAMAACELLITLHRKAEREAKRRRRELQYGPTIPQTVKAYPTLLNAMIRANLVPAGRVYLALRAYDQTGGGVVDLGRVSQLFTGKRSKWRIYKTWRGLRHVLAQGDGKLWTRADGRLWLYGPARIAEALKCGRLTGLPVLLPVRSLLKSLQHARAHFFTSYESGRQSGGLICQPALADATGVSERTQYTYNKLLKRTARTNITVTGLDYTPENAQQVAADKQRSVFPFVDWLGKRGGPKKACYVAYRIADTRSICHKQAARGRLRKINRMIDLVEKPERGNSRKVDRAYHQKAADAAAAYNRDPGIDHYWPNGSAIVTNAMRKSRLQGIGVWGVLLA